jgi:hypothetical protein
MTGSAAGTRQPLIAYLRTDGERLPRGGYPEAVGGALFAAVAEATLLAAWMTYDSTPRSPHAQRYFIQALGLAQAAGDRLLGAGILDAMSHQATYTSRFTEAANLARAAKTGTTGTTGIVALAGGVLLAGPVRYGPARDGPAAGPLRVLSTVRAGWR